LNDATPQTCFSPLTWIWRQAWLLLILTTLLWGANGVAGRMAIGEISPMCLVFLRWLIACTILAASLRGRLTSELPLLLPFWKRTFIMGFFGLSAFAALFYLAAYKTSAVNLTLLQSSIPPFVLAGAAILFRIRVLPMQIIGMLITLLGVLLVATHGDLAHLYALSFNSGDLLVLIACLFYAGYTLGLRNRPPTDALVFFAGLAAAAFITSIPFFVIELWRGETYWPSFKGWLVLIFIALGPSLASQLTYMRAVELIGPSRAGLFANLVPVFGAILAVLILGETFALHHALALILALGGIYLAERSLLGTSRPSKPKRTDLLDLR
jgi:drug/metabolite transporter (DMT)-like permease